MKRLILLLAASAFASPALAQGDPHAGHHMPAQQQPADDPHAGHQMPAEEPAADPHAGHAMPADPHAGHQMGSTPTPPVMPPPAVASSGPEHAADAVFGAEAMRASRNVLAREHGGMSAYKLMVERAETRIRGGRDTYLVDAQAWFGGDIDKLWLKSEVEGDWRGGSPHAEVQALWSRAIDPWFDLQAGVRQDFQSGPDRTHLVLGVQGLAPHWWEVDGALFLSTRGDLTARAEAEYDLRITQGLILQPRIEVELAAQDIDELGIGAGLSTAALGARLRYHLTPQIAPYIGVEYERAFGGTADFRRDEGDKAGGWNLLAGLRFWL